MSWNIDLKQDRKNFDEIVIDFLIYDPNSFKVLIQKRSETRRLFPGSWDLTGGHLEAEEGIKECIKRELKEETNMNLLKITRLVHEFVWKNNSVKNYVFQIEAEGDFQGEVNKISEHKWISKKNLREFENDKDMNAPIFETLKIFFEND